MNWRARWLAGCILALTAAGCGRGCHIPGAAKKSPSTSASNTVATNATKPFPPNKLQHVQFPKRKVGIPIGLPGKTVYVDAFPTLNEGQGLLEQELLRQALLIAARDGMGLSTRDRSLRDAFPQDDESSPPLLGVVYNTSRPKTLAVTVYREGETGPDVVWEEAQTSVVDMTFEEQVTIAERLSRGEFVGALGKAGYKSEVSETRHVNIAFDTDRIDRLLGDLNFQSQYEAILRIHGELLKSRESSVLLAALSRGYANLGALTEYLWSSANRALKARALLYAERLVAGEKESPRAYYTRGYVRALVGRHGAALEDLEQARQFAKRVGNAAPGETAEPPWVAPIEAFCRFDRKRQQELAADEKNRPLIRYLQFLARKSSASEHAQLECAGAVLEVAPDCWQAIDLLSHSDTLGVRRMATGQALASFPNSFYRRLKDVPGLPADVVELCSKHSSMERTGDDDLELPDGAAAEFADRMKAIHSLRRVADRTEPSFGLLAHLIEETGFMHVRAMIGLERVLGVPSNETLAVFRPLYAEHRFSDYIELKGRERAIAADFIERIRKGLQSWQNELEYTALPLIRAMNSQRDQPARVTERAVLARIDPVFGDLTGIVPASSGGISVDLDFRMISRLLPAVSPHSPQAVIGKIATTSGLPLDELVLAVEQNYADDADVLEAMANRLESVERKEDAIRFLKLAVKVSPEYRTYTRLASLYWNSKRKPQWRETLDEFLQRDTLPGLQHARVQVQIANELMRQGEYQEALPYAVAAAESYAEWALMAAHRCYDALQDWEQAEAYIRAAAGRYDSASTDWLEWCLFRGRGDVKSARKLADRRIATLGDRRDQSTIVELCHYYQMIGDDERAFQVLDVAFPLYKDHSLPLYAAFVADELGRPKDRDRHLQVPLDSMYATRNNPISQVVLARLIVDAFTAPDGPKFDIDALDELMRDVQSTVHTEAPKMQYFAGRWLLKYGPREKGIEYLRQSATSPDLDFSCTMAAIVLRKEELDVGPTRRKE
jgi:tetratricopeptide (TPR) repeat protein